MKQKKRIFALLLALCLIFAFGATAYAADISDIGATVSSGIRSIIATVRSVINPIAILATIGCGLYFILGDDQANVKKAKSWGIGILAGLLLINVAEPLVDWASRLGGGTAV